MQAWTFCLVPLKIAHSNLGQGLLDSLVGVVAGAQVASEVPERRSGVMRGSGRRVGAEVEAAVVRGYRSGETIDALAERLGIHRTTVMAVLERRRVPRRRQGQVLSAAQVERAVALYGSGLSLKAVAGELGADWRVVTRALRDAGVVIRRSGRYSQA